MSNTRSRILMTKEFLDAARRDFEIARVRVAEYEKEIQHLLVLERDEMATEKGCPDAG